MAGKLSFREFTSMVVALRLARYGGCCLVRGVVMAPQIRATTQAHVQHRGRPQQIQAGRPASGKGSRKNCILLLMN